MTAFSQAKFSRYAMDLTARSQFAGNGVTRVRQRGRMNLRTVSSEVDEGVVVGDDRCPLCNESHRAVAPTGPERILIAEDEPCVASLIAYNLEQDGYRVSLAADGDEALR